MTANYIETLDANSYRCTDAELTFALYEVASPTVFQSFGGTLTGPSCRYAKTLPSTTKIPLSEASQDGASTFTQCQLIDPCYWTPRLPFLYKFMPDISYADGSSASIEHTLGLRRWETDGQNFLLERKRTVLRGVFVRQELEIDLDAAHGAELAVMVPNPSRPFLQEASEQGVMIIADIRDCSDNLTNQLLSFTWQPSVGIVLPTMDACYLPHSQILAASINSAGHDSMGVLSEDWVKVVIVELETGEKPSASLAQIDKPVIAIRRGVEFADLHAARAACDRLQAELAPEFDLAGYFVAP
ncbi:MAG: hypothetical protein AAGD11_04595 [Planctomycetota bacterium]